MKFKLTTGVNPNGDVIPMDKRGTILPSTNVATALRQSLASNVSKCPRLAGKKKD